MIKMGVLLILCYCIYYFSNFISSPFLFVFGDDRVIRYTRADDDTCDAEDVQATQ